jgi:Fe-S oxidoreductase/FAD/FMN-containing dehydrogenase
MRELPDALKQGLKDTFDGRVTFDPLERSVYSHDVGTFPKLVRPLLGNTMPGAVVQPQNEEELLELVRLANVEKVPLVPRGMATSGYGGVLPVRGGLVVDLRRMDRILEIDGDSLTATVETGVIWGYLERELAKSDLALRTYPSSALSSTVGGWLAQGGAGYGSLEYGWFRENVVSARVVLPTGEVRMFSGDDLDLISDAEGIVGLISQVTMRVRRLEAESVIGVQFTDARSLAAAFQEIVDQGIPLWSINFINPWMATLKNRLLAGSEHGEPVEQGEHSLPESYIALFVYPRSRTSEVTEQLEAVISAQGMQILDEGLAAQEWAERYSVMRVRQLGPSLIPTEVVVPLGELGAVLTEIEEKVKQPLVLDGIVTKGREVVFLGFIPHDERSFNFNMAFVLSLSVIKTAKAHGGRPFSAGLYFAREAEHVLGKERLTALRGFKAQVDPNNVMNPGKILGDGLFGAFMGLAGIIEPLARPIGNMAKPPARRAAEAREGIPATVALFAYTCAQCGACVPECGQFFGSGWESQGPRGKWFFLREVMEGRAARKGFSTLARLSGSGPITDEPLAEWSKRLYDCTLCGRCGAVCPLGLDTRSLWVAARKEMVQQGLYPEPFDTLREMVTTKYNISGDDNEQRLIWAENLEVVPDGVRGKETAETVYFVGCTPSFYPQTYGIPQAAVTVMEKAGLDFTLLGGQEWCCGYPLIIAGMGDAVTDLVKHNVEAVRAKGARRLVAGCPSCYHTWLHQYPEIMGEPLGFEVVHTSQLLEELLADGRLKLGEFPRPVTYHDPCDLGRNSGIYEAPRNVIQSVPGITLVEMVDNRQYALCCGGGGDVAMCNQELVETVARRRLHQALDTEAQVLLSACQQCKRTLMTAARQEKARMQVLDIVELVAKVMEG